MPTCLPRLVKADVISQSTGLSVKRVYRLGQLHQIPLISRATNAF